MPVRDTLSAFYLWDTVPYPVTTQVPDPGVAVDSTYSLFFVPNAEAVHDTLTRVSLFVGHALPMQHTGLTERGLAGASAWVFAVLLVLVALTTLYFRQHKVGMRSLLASLVDGRTMDRMLRNNNMARTLALVPIGMLVSACMALPVHQLALEETGVVGYLLLAAALTVLYLLRNGLQRLLATVFDDRQAVAMYITSNYLYHLTLAVVLLPLLLLQTYLPFGGDVLLWVLAGVVVLEFLMRAVRGLNVFLTNSSCSHFYLFYYLCTVEIVPILILVKCFLT